MQIILVCIRVAGCGKTSIVQALLASAKDWWGGQDEAALAQAAAAALNSAALSNAVTRMPTDTGVMLNEAQQPRNLPMDAEAGGIVCVEDCAYRSSVAQILSSNA